VKRITLLRHAKSSWAAPASPDRDRELADRGHRDLRVMGRRLLARKARPSLILSSPAVRAASTARAIASALSYPEEFLQFEDQLYLATPDEILGIIEIQDDKFSDVMLIGHNPGLTDLANALLPDLHLHNLPTCGVIAIDIAVTAWSEVDSGSTALAYFDYPKNPEVLLIED